MKTALLFTVASGALLAQGQPIAFGSALEADQQILESQQLAKDVLSAPNPQRHTKGDQHRTYDFPAAKKAMPYRLYVPTTWDGQSRLPLIVMLHGAGSDENRYMDMNNKQITRLAEQHGYVVISPLGYSPMGAYGTPLRLPAVFGQPEVAAKQRAGVTPEAEHTLELSEKDVINVLEIVLNEYPINRSSVFLAGHSMGSGGTWYLGAKYSKYWRAIAPMSGPFIDQANYPWEHLRSIPIMMSEGTLATPSVQGSHVMRDWMFQQDFTFEYYEVKPITAAWCLWYCRPSSTSLTGIGRSKSEQASRRHHCPRSDGRARPTLRHVNSGWPGRQSN